MAIKFETAKIERYPATRKAPELEPVAATKRARGRPALRADKPWTAAGISRRTWYRRLKEGAVKA